MKIIIFEHETRLKNVEVKISFQQISVEQNIFSVASYVDRPLTEVCKEAQILETAFTHRTLAIEAFSMPGGGLERLVVVVVVESCVVVVVVVLVVVVVEMVACVSVVERVVADASAGNLE